MRLQTCKPQSLLTFGIMLLMVSLGQGAQPDLPTGSGASGETLKPAIRESAVQPFDKNFETFAPVVDKVAPAVVRIVTAAKLDGAADLAGAITDPLQRYLVGR